MPRFNLTRIPRPPIDISDSDFDDWHVLHELPRDPVYPYRRRWLCQCSCGKIKPILQSSLLLHRSKSCGHEHRQRLGNKTHKHGLRRKSIYMRWWSMLRRCYDSKVQSYPHYGKRGIAVCASWHEFENFFADMGHPPFEGASLDRIDNDGHYSCGKCSECLSNNWPMNLRWANKWTQGANRRQARPVTINGESKTLGQWAYERNLNEGTVRTRVRRYGWTPEEALNFIPRRVLHVQRPTAFKKGHKPHNLGKKKRPVSPLLA